MWNNVQTRYQSQGRTFHIPTEKGKAIGLQLRGLLADYRFAPFYRHLGGGSAIQILHAHRRNQWFATADISRFFPNIMRWRVAQSLRAAGIEQHRHFAKWSTVKGEGGYVLPLGFPQSSLLATMVMQQSVLGAFLTKASRAVTLQVYLDDISISSNDLDTLNHVYRELRRAVIHAGFALNQEKSQRPAGSVELFGCTLEQGRAAVSEPRRAEFYAQDRGSWSAEWFEKYCHAVEIGNHA